MRGRKIPNTGKGLVNAAVKNGCEVRSGKGSHVVVSNEKGSCVIPVHGNKQLGTGIFRAIVKTLSQMGALGVMVLVILNLARLGLL